MITRYVNTASSAGGDGTTSATTGANRAYVSLAAFEATLGTLADNYTVYCTGATADTGVNFNGITPAGYYINVIGDQDWSTTTDISTSKYRIVSTAQNAFSVNNTSLTVNVSNIGLILDVSKTDQRSFYCQAGTLNVDKCVIHGNGTPASNAYGSVFRGNGGTVNATNCCVYSIATVVWNVNNAINITAIACYWTLRPNIVKIENWIMQDSIVDNNYDVACDYMLTDSASLGGGGTNNRLSKTLTFVDKANRNYHLAASDTDAIGYGIGPSADADVPTSDIDGNTRSGATTDIGADLYISSSPTRLFYGLHSIFRGVSNGICVGVG